jgi:thiamine-monophosphate kinase
MGDDAAIWERRWGYEPILSCDWFLEGTHFLREKHPANAVGWKCLARALSDIAAMGGEPRCFLLSLALPESHIGVWLEEFLRGLRRASRHFRCLPAGGDTTRSKRILISVTVVGEARKGEALLRSGARPGDALFVSGRLGEAELGLRELREKKSALGGLSGQLRKHLYPEPRLELGQWLAKRKLATAMMDLSDGLSSDLPRLCAASRVGAVIEEAQLPLARVSQSGRRQADALGAALDGGDDYELLFTVPGRKASRLRGKIAGTKVTRIGTITGAQEIAIVRKNAQTEKLRAHGWDPFRKR